MITIHWYSLILFGIGNIWLGWTIRHIFQCFKDDKWEWPWTFKFREIVLPDKQEMKP